MNYSKMVGICQTVAPLSELKGIGDEPLAPLSDGATMIMHKPCGASLPGVKIDQHASFPKGLPRAFQLHEKD